MAGRGRGAAHRRGARAPGDGHVLSARSRALVAILAFIALALAVQLGVLRAIDRDLIARVQSVARPELDLLGSMVTVLGHAEVTAGIAAGLAVARLRARRADFWVPLAIALTVVIESAGKILIAQPMPPHDLHRDLEFVRGVAPPFAHAFPSGHVARDAFLLLIMHGWPRVAILAAVIVVVVSRVYLGQHWPSDTLGGLLLGAGVAWGARSLARRVRGVRARQRESAQRVG